MNDMAICWLLIYFWRSALALEKSQIAVYILRIDGKIVLSGVCKFKNNVSLVFEINKFFVRFFKLNSFLIIRLIFILPFLLKEYRK